MEQVKGSPSGAEFELKITAEPTIEKHLCKPQANPAVFRVTHHDIVRFGYTSGCKGCRAARVGARQQAHDEGCRARKLRELIEDCGRKRQER